MKMVFLVIRDDGNSQEAEESVDSVWLTRVDAERRMAAITDAPFGSRIEAHGIGLPGRQVALTMPRASVPSTAGTVARY